jgi:3-hydroxyisobutyrate dehydrogenase-like beta-hydroxyacid dehydrogenase
MGAAVGRRLSDNGVEVVTTLENRGAASQARAAAAAMQPVSTQQLADSDFMLSIVPPAAALEFAQAMAPLLRSAPHKPVFVDCNAVSPDTAQRIAAVIEPTGAPFVDAGIIGPPPGAGGVEPSIYASGAAATKFSVLRERGLAIRVLDGPIGAASALKMCYAGIQKGVTAVATAMTLAAARVGVSAELKQELAQREPQYLAALTRKVPNMLPKAYRWVAEMQEISKFTEPDGASDIYAGAAEIYQRVARALAEGGPEVETLRAFFTLK